MRTNRLTGLGLLIAMLAAMTATGCNSNLKEQNALLKEENQGLREQIVDRNAALDAAQGELRDRDVQIAELSREIDEARWSLQEAARVPAPQDPFAGIEGVTGSVGAGEVTASVESDVLFDSGKSTLKSTAKRSLDQVARILRNDYGGKPIRVEGHTDIDPIRKSGFKSNYHLAFERAFAVREYLISAGVPESRVYLASYGPNRARSTKKESRRVEIAVVLNE